MATVYFSRTFKDKKRASAYFYDKARAERRIEFQMRMDEDMTHKTVYELASGDDSQIPPEDLGSVV